MWSESPNYKVSGLGPGSKTIMAMGEVQGDLGDEMDRWRVGHGEGVDIDHVLGGGWPAEYETKMVKMVNCVQEEEEDVLMRKVSLTPSGTKETL